MSASFDDRATANLAVEADRKEPTRSKQASEDLQPTRRISHVMQHTEAFDEVEALAELGEMQNIGLQVLDIREAVFLRLTHGVAQAGRAKIHG